LGAYGSLSMSCRGFSRARGGMRTTYRIVTPDCSAGDVGGPRLGCHVEVQLECQLEFGYRRAAISRFVVVELEPIGEGSSGALDSLRWPSACRVSFSQSRLSKAAIARTCILAQHLLLVIKSTPET
jgi:hypothetical protein